MDECRTQGDESKDKAEARQPYPSPHFLQDYVGRHFDHNVGEVLEWALEMVQLSIQKSKIEEQENQRVRVRHTKAVEAQLKSNPFMLRSFSKPTTLAFPRLALS